MGLPGVPTHRLTCLTCPTRPELAVDEGRLRPEAVTLFQAGHPGHRIRQEVARPTAAELRFAARAIR